MLGLCPSKGAAGFLLHERSRQAAAVRVCNIPPAAPAQLLSEEEARLALLWQGSGMGEQGGGQYW